jgi:organic hydroperoxide reductase OsmC/OhrA
LGICTFIWLSFWTLVGEANNDDRKTLDLGIRVDMKVMVKGLEKGKLDKLVARTQEVCPYSRATKGNVPTSLEVVAL